MQTIDQLKKEVENIKVRNKRVEADKRWETSWTRKALLAIFTYLAIALYLYAIKISNPWLNAVVPTIGFLLSTLTMSFFKNLWSRFIDKN